jgi:SAM-dependent methyltransferase
VLKLRGALAEARDTAEARVFASRLADAKSRPRPGIHSFHRWYGKLIPAIPAAAIEAWTSPGQLVLDPFCGSGTTLVEALVAGRAAEGTDVNPLATLLSRVKTRVLAPERLEDAARDAAARLEADDGADWRTGLPAMPNREHFHPDPVARDLVRLLDAVRREPELELREWLEALVSAINRDVSNADTRHVFPGVSKRMRALIADGWRGDVPSRWARALKDRLAWSRELHAAVPLDAPPVVVRDGPAASLPGPPGRAALVVTNPPYVSSIRWVETFKLESWWLGLVRARGDLQALDRAMLGTERLDHRTPPTADELDRLPAPCARPALERLLAAGEARRARVVLTFLTGLSDSLSAAARALRPGGRFVLKIAPSRLRGVVVPTPEACAEILQAEGLELAGVVEDDYDATSRSLTPARNWYSGRMDADAILVLRRPDEP